MDEYDCGPDEDDDDPVPTAQDVDAAARLARIHFFHGHEPYAPAVYSFAKMLCAYRLELEAKTRPAS